MISTIWTTVKHHIYFSGLGLGFLILLAILANFKFGNRVNILKSTISTNQELCDLAVVWPSDQVSRVRCTERLSKSEIVGYLKSQSVKAVAPVRSYKISLIPNDPNYKFQKPYLEQIRAPIAWDKLSNSALRPVIAVLDSGVDIDNPDLKNNIWFNPWEVPGDGIDNDGNGYVDDQYGWDFINNTPDPRPKFDSGWTEVAMQHGTIVAGVASAVGNNGEGVAGIAWNSKIMPIRVLNGKGVGDTVTVAKGIMYAIQNRADIINLSFVGSLSDPLLEDAIDRAYRAGILVVAAAGNEQQIGVDMAKQPQYPVCDDGLNGENEVIGVAAVDEYDKLADFSNYGSRCIDLSAPGTHIYNTQFVDLTKKQFTPPYGGYWSGTSVAAPMVSGALALLKAAYPRLSSSQVRDVLIASGDSIDLLNPNFVGKLGRRINLKSAMELAGNVKFSNKNPLVIAPQSGAQAEVVVYDFAGDLVQKFLAYNPKFTKGINVSVGDIDGNGQIEIITAPRAGGGPHIKIFSQRGELEFQFMAFNEKFIGGVSLTMADFTADSKDEIVVGTGKGASNLVRIFDGQGIMRYQFVPYELSYTGGINLAAGDVDNDGQPEVIVSPQGSARLPVRVFDKFGHKKAEFYPYPGVFRGGVNLAVGDANGDDKLDILTAPGAGGGPQVKVFTYKGKLVKQFLAYAKNFRGGVNLAVGDIDGDNANEIITTPGAGGGPHLRVFTTTSEVKSQFFIEPIDFKGGLSLAVFR